MFNVITLNIILIIVVGINATTTQTNLSPDKVRVKENSSKVGENEKEKIVKDSEDILTTGKFFQDIFAELLMPDKLQFGHVCEDPSHWEQRFEEKDFSKNRHRGKFMWGHKDGSYGEHYWDLNH